MAMTASTERVTPVRSRVHGGAYERAISKKPSLVVVAPQRRTARWIVAGCVVVFGLMLGAAAFQTQIARRQLTIDTLDRRIRAAHQQYDVLRRERAELRSPGRLAAQAAALGMVPATQTEFQTLDPAVVAVVQRSGAPSDHVVKATIEEEFAAYAHVKAQAGIAP